MSAKENQSASLQNPTVTGSDSNILSMQELGLAKQTSATTSENYHLNLNFDRTVSFDSFA